jgi:pimeloyl-ACP methyl ester carboxylesterase
MADRSHLISRDIDLDTHVLDVVNLVKWEELSDVVLCGHSYGGAVVSGVANLIPDRIRSLVYLDAFLLEDGENVLQHAPIEEDWVTDGWKVRPIPAGKFNVNIVDRDWVDRQCTTQSIGCWRQPLTDTSGINRIGKIVYILAKGWDNGKSPFAPFFEKARARGWKTVTIASGHDVMLDKPEELARALIEAS